MAFTKVLPAGISSSFNLTVDSINSVGVVTATGIVASTGTFSGNVSIAGTLTYEDVTNIDSVGVITAQNTIDAQGNVTVGAGLSVVGVSTFKNNIHITSGNLGIGTDNPNASLHVEKDGTSQILARFESNMGTNNNRAISIKSPTSDSSSEPFIFGTGNSYQFQTDDQVGLHINFDRKIGIGTDNPSAKLEVVTSVDGEATLATFKNISGGGTNETVDIKLGLENTVASNVILRAGKEANHNSSAATDNFFAIHTTENNISSEKLRITSSGNLGIGTDNPGSILEVHSDTIPRINSVYNNSKHCGMSVGGSGGGFSLTDGHFMTVNHQPYSDRGTDNNLTERLRITANGDIVVGSGFTDFQSSTQGESASTSPYKLVFQNQYSNGYTDDQLKLYLFNSGPTRQGFGPGPNYDLQYHCSGGVADQARHRFYTDNVLRMEIHDAYTGVTKPTQPGFYARRTTAGDGRSAGSITEWHTSGTGSYNEGGHFKTTGSDVGKFVAPVAGRYYFSAQPGYKQTGQDFQFYFRIDGGIINEPVRVIDGGDDLTSHSGFTGSCIVSMGAGQKLDIYIGNTHHVNTTYNFFCGYLIG